MIVRAAGSNGMRAEISVFCLTETELQTFIAQQFPTQLLNISNAAALSEFIRSTKLKFWRTASCEVASAIKSIYFIHIPLNI
jgi:hypothetical protein